MQALETVRNLRAIQELQQLGGEIFLVGGIVRDHYLGKESKDIDIIVRLVPLELVIDSLSDYGKVEVVGESYGVIKFIPKGWTSEPIDVALPRTEKKQHGGVGHKAFDVQADANLPIEADLLRRDITINSIALGLDGTLVDPVGGLEDLRNKTIRATSPQAFSDDPLRMLRCIQFAARFNFTIEAHTLAMIARHAKQITEITPERVREELDKMHSKSDTYGRFQGLDLLNGSGISAALFGQELAYTHHLELGTRPEFYASLLHSLPDPAQAFKKNLKGDNDTEMLIKSLITLLRETDTNDTVFQRRVKAVKALKMSSAHRNPDILLTLPSTTYLMGTVLDGMPKRITELAVDGNDLLALGLQGKELGTVHNAMFMAVLDESVPNEKEALLTFIGK